MYSKNYKAFNNTTSKQFLKSKITLGYAMREYVHNKYEKETLSWTTSLWE